MESDSDSKSDDESKKDDGYKKYQDELDKWRQMKQRERIERERKEEYMQKQEAFREKQRQERETYTCNNPSPPPHPITPLDYIDKEPIQQFHTLNNLILIRSLKKVAMNLSITFYQMLYNEKMLDHGIIEMLRNFVIVVLQIGNSGELQWKMNLSLFKTEIFGN